MFAVFYNGAWTVCRPEEAPGHAASVAFTNLFLSAVIPAAASLSFTVNISESPSVPVWVRVEVFVWNTVLGCLQAGDSHWIKCYWFVLVQWLIQPAAQVEIINGWKMNGANLGFVWLSQGCGDVRWALINLMRFSPRLDQQFDSGTRVSIFYG